MLSAIVHRVTDEKNADFVVRHRYFFLASQKIGNVARAYELPIGAFGFIYLERVSGGRIVLKASNKMGVKGIESRSGCTPA